MKKKTEKIVTIPKLAEMISRSFQNTQDSMNKRFEQMDERFNQVNKEISEVKKGIKVVNRKLDSFIDDYPSPELRNSLELQGFCLGLHLCKNSSAYFALPVCLRIFASARPQAKTFRLQAIS